MKRDRTHCSTRSPCYSKGNGTCVFRMGENENYKDTAEDAMILAANNSEQSRRVPSYFHVRLAPRFSARLWIIPLVQVYRKRSHQQRTLAFIVIQVNTQAPCCGNSRNPSVTEGSFVSSVLAASALLDFIFLLFARFPALSLSLFPSRLTL